MSDQNTNQNMAQNTAQNQTGANGVSGANWSNDAELTSIQNSNFTAELNDILDQAVEQAGAGKATGAVDELMGALTAHQEIENEINEGSAQIYNEVNDAIDQVQNARKEGSENAKAEDVRSQLADLDQPQN